MPEKASYDLMVLLDSEAPEERRTEMVERIRGQIQAGDATLKGDADWGMRRLAYEIDHRAEAQYHLYQFEAAPEVLSELDRSLSIDDAVLRFRIIRLRGEAPAETPKAPPQTSFEGARREGRGRDGAPRAERHAEEPEGDEAPAAAAEEPPQGGDTEESSPAEPPAAAPEGENA